MQKISQTINFPSITRQIDRMYKLRKKFPKFPGREMNSKPLSGFWDISLQNEKLSLSLQYFPIYKQIKLQFILRKLSFGNHPSRRTSSSFGMLRIILRRLTHPSPSVRLGLSSGASLIRLIQYVSDYPPAPYSSKSQYSTRNLLPNHQSRGMRMSREMVMLLL